MAPPTAPPAGQAAKKKRQRLIIMGAAGVALLLFLYMRSQSSSGSSSTAAQTNATNAADTQQAIDNAVAQQQAQDASTYGYGAYGAGGGVDTSGIESGLSTIDTDLQNLPSAIAAQGAVSAAAVPPPSTNPAKTPPITVNINGHPAGSGGTGGVKLSTGVPRGDIAAPFGHRKPTAPKGYRAVGLGHGNWAYAPIRPTGHHHRHRRRR